MARFRTGNCWPLQRCLQGLPRWQARVREAKGRRDCPDQGGYLEGAHGGEAEAGQEEEEGNAAALPARPYTCLCLTPVLRCLAQRIFMSIYQSSTKVSEAKEKAVQPCIKEKDYSSAEDRAADHRTTSAHVYRSLPTGLNASSQRNRHA